jgi:hypothetical protein
MFVGSRSDSTWSLPLLRPLLASAAACTPLEKQQLALAPH